MAITEITPLSEKDCFYIVERYKKEFTYPLHSHEEFELNFIENGKGAIRIVNDSIETIDNYELVLVGGENTNHVWEQGSCTYEKIREITIQFSQDLFSSSFLSKNQFMSIKKMLTKAKYGLKFSLPTIIKVYSLLDTMSDENRKFYQVMKILTLLYELSISEGGETLSSCEAYLPTKESDSRRTNTVKNYISKHYNENITLTELAEIVCMNPVSFSRFFKLRTGKTLSDYIIDVRLGVASRVLVDTTKNISEVCFECGFNNLSNFNRIFKKKKGMTPKQFRNFYQKKKFVI
ncbi:MAG: AraC family transcriptional regulator [Bacteroidales bacterium]